MRFVAGRGAVADRLVRGTAVAERLMRGTAVAERHREDVACCGTADAEPAGREPSAQRTACWGADEAAARQGRWHRARGAAAAQGRRQCESAPAGQGRWQKARAGAGRQILSDSPSDLAITSAAQVLPYVFTAVRGISQSC